MKLILIGIQGSGKSTQGNLLSQKLAIPYISMGNIFREMAKQETDLGKFIAQTINGGNLIPDEKTLAIIGEYLKKPEYQNGYILDGFPRTLIQAKAFTDNINFVISLLISDKEALWRISGRNDNREDETLAAIKKRIGLFHEVTEPVLDYYKEKGILLEINGEQTIEAINQEILSWQNPNGK